MKKGGVLDKTPFYASSGGQKADFGSIQGFDVENVIKLPNNQHLHMIRNHNLKLNDKVYAKVDELKRDSVSRNHSAAHLFHQAIRELLGDHSSQKDNKFLRIHGDLILIIMKIYLKNKSFKLKI